MFAIGRRAEQNIFVSSKNLVPLHPPDFSLELSKSRVSPLHRVLVLNQAQCKTIRNESRGKIESVCVAKVSFTLNFRVKCASAFASGFHTRSKTSRLGGTSQSTGHVLRQILLRKKACQGNEIRLALQT